MQEKFLFILCILLSQGIKALLEEKDQVSSIITRKKRLINHFPYAIEGVRIEQVPYIVHILKDGIGFCGGSILAPTIIITAAHCIVDNEATYIILSGSPFRDCGLYYNITKRSVYRNYNLPDLSNDLALVQIWPPINFPNQKIDLYNGSLPRNAYGVLSGWGCIQSSEELNIFPHALQSIKVYLISRQQWKRDYADYSTTTSKDICTLDANKQTGSCYGDSGGPLVVNARLLGVLAWSRGLLNQGNPDVSVNLALAIYKNWINSMMSRHQIQV